MKRLWYLHILFNLIIKGVETMQNLFRGIIHFIAAVTMFTLIGLALASLTVQSKFIDMHFDVDVLITMGIIVGILVFFMRVFMNAKFLGLWEKPKQSLSILIISLLIIVVFNLSSLTTLPGIMFKKAIYMQGMSDSFAFTSLLVIVILAFICSQLAAKLPITLKKDTNMQWDKLLLSSKITIITTLTLLVVCTMLYLGQGNINAIINNAVIYLKNADVEGFKEYLLSFGALAAFISGALMVFQAIIAPLPAFVITFANGLLFGWFYGALLSWSSAMLGAVLCFFIAKFLGRPVVERIISKRMLNWWDQFFERYGKHSVFLARIIPIISFDLVSYGAGVTSIKFWHFFWATGLGQLPATLLYSYLGQSATGAVAILFYLFIIVIALGVLGVIFKPMIEKKLGKNSKVESVRVNE